MVAHTVQAAAGPRLVERPLEIVERKGLGHPDTICDAIAEHVSQALCARYREAAGRVLHHNVDKVALIAGASSPTLGGGRVDQPLRLVLAGRATAHFDGHSLDVGGIGEEAARGWLRTHLRALDADAHVVLQD